MIHNFGSLEKKWSVLSVSRAHEHDRFTVSAKSCLNLCSRKWLKPNLSLLRSLDPCGSQILKILFSEGLMKFNIFFRNISWESRFLISGCNLFLSLILKGKIYLKSSETDLFYNLNLCSNQDYDGSL